MADLADLQVVSMDVQNVFELQYLVYIAGILVPSQQVGITSAYNVPPTATITLPPYPELFGIGRKDRVPVHIFVKESWAGTDNYILIFEGEINSFSYSSTSLGREINVNAHGLLTFLRDVNIRILTTQKDIEQTNVTKGENLVAMNMITPSQLFPSSLFMYGLAPIDPSNLIKAPTQFLANAYTFVQTENVMKGQRGPSSVLIKYYEDYSTQIRLLDRYPHVPYFDDDDNGVWTTTGGVFPLIAGMRSNEVIQQITKMSQDAMAYSQGPIKASIFDLVDMMVTQMQYEFAFICAPRYVKGKLYSSCLKPIFYESPPPACNIMYRSMVTSIQTTENVYQVPTRVRMDDEKGPINVMTRGSNAAITKYGSIDYFPTEQYSKNQPSLDQSANWYATELLTTEYFTGTYMYDTPAPEWLSYIKPISFGLTGTELKQRAMEYLLLIKQFSERKVRVRGAFNPYITPGFPGAVYDSDDMRFSFVGHVISVDHELSKSGASTTVTMSFVRTIDEALSEATALINVVPTVNAVTTNFEKMSKIYEEVLGCSAVSFNTLKDLTDSSLYEAHNSPRRAYLQTYRDIADFTDYCTFMGITTTSSYVEEDGTKVPSVLGGNFLERRNDSELTASVAGKWAEAYPGEAPAPNALTGIRCKLKAIADRELLNKIYE